MAEPVRDTRVDELPCAIVEIDRDGIIREANAVFCDWIAAPLEEARGRVLSAFLDESRPDGLARLAVSGGGERVVHAARSTHGDVSCVVLLDASERARYEEQLRRTRALEERTRRRLELVIEASIAFAEADTEPELAEILARTVAEAYQAEHSVVFLLDQDGVFRQAAGSNPFEEIVETRSLAAQALALRSVVTISGPDEARGIHPIIADAFETAGIESLIVAPLRHDGAPIGLFACFFRHPRAFDGEAMPLADALAGQAAQVATTIRLQRRLHHAAMHDETTALDLATRLRAGIEAPWTTLPEGYAVSASIGMAIAPGHGPRVAVDRLIRAADQAMYRAKSAGGNRIEADGTAGPQPVPAA